MRIRVNFDSEWRFHLGDVANTKKNSHTDAYYVTKAGRQYNPAAREWDDSTWQAVDLPHDYIVGMPFSADEDISHGYHVKENAWYRKVFLLPREWEGKHVLLSFEGISVASKIYCNGSLMTAHNSGYIEANVDITDRVHFGDVPNTVAVYVDGKSTEGWWYEGAGLYRHVRLYVKDPVHIAHNGVYVRPELCGEGEDFTTNVSILCENSSYEAATVRPRVKLFFEDELVAEALGEPITVPPSATAEGTMVMPAMKVSRWDVDTPNLYRAEITLLQDFAEIDTEVVSYGYRTVEVRREEGFILNGRPLKLCGVCNHQDHAGVGVAVPDSIQDYRVRLLKEMGVNAYRMAHNPPAREILDACDRYGILVMDEHRRFEANPEQLFYLETLIRRDRNHPSVVMWSLFNEEPLQNTPEGAAIFRRQRATVERLDATRPILGAMNGNAEGAGQYMSVTGINYGIARAVADDAYRKYPHLAFIGSENCSTLATRGCTETSPRGKIKNSTFLEGYENDPQVMSDYDEEYPSWGDSVRATWAYSAARPWHAGIFIWTGFDYRGEPTPFCWPSVSSQFGLMDTCGNPKAAYYYTKACFTDRPMVHINPHWNFKEGETVRVAVISNCEEVELFLNGRSLGRRPSTVSEQNEWQVPFEAGIISAVAYRGGEAVARAERKTAGKAVAIRLSADRPWLMADGHDAVPVTVSLVDAEGNILPTATDHVSFSVEGGRILGTGNGDPNSHEDDTKPERDLFAGLAQVIVGRTYTDGTPLCLRAHVEGLPDATLSLTALKAPEEVRVGYCMIRTLSSLTASDITAERPDYLRPLADNDMNTLSPISLGDHFDPNFTEGWRFLRSSLPLVGKGGRASCVLEFSNTHTEELRIGINGQELYVAEAVWGPRRVVLELPEAPDYDLRILVKAWGNKPSGLAGTIRLLVL